MALLIAGIIGMLGMGFSTAKTAITYDADSDKIDKQLADSQQKYDDLKTQLDTLIKNQVAIDADIRDYINEQLTNIINLQIEMDIVRKNSTTRYRTMEVTGIIIISTVIFLFILKAFGLLDDIERAFVGLFKKKQ